MTEQETNAALLELAHARIAWARAVPHGTSDEIQKALEETAQARHALAEKMRRLDHLLGHPLSFGPCACGQHEAG